MSYFEIVMLVCFGAAWPFSIYRSCKSGRNDGKSVLFLFVVLVGYFMGICHKVYFRYDEVVFLYVLNASMVFIDIVFYYKNKRMVQL
ncbi:MAG: hypothetical protein KAQ98_10110 [Bacteriovoracaceae bacterium]|nr:hypothetical protein [Bacteriovoracaceae bacterium]